MRSMLYSVIFIREIYVCALLSTNSFMCKNGYNKMKKRREVFESYAVGG